LADRGSSSDCYVSGGVNWAGFTLEQLVAMVSDNASVPQLERLAQDWRTTGKDVVAASEFLAGALDELMNFWSGSAAAEARRTVALNAQWVSDLGTTAQDMGDPIDEAAGALRAAQAAMPALPAVPPPSQPGSAPLGAAEAVDATGSPLGGAVGGASAGSQSAFDAAAQQEELKRVAVETMQRFESAAIGIDQVTPRFETRGSQLRPRPADGADPTGQTWLSALGLASTVDMRWQLLTALPDGTPTGLAGAEAGDPTGRSVVGGFFGAGGGRRRGGGGGEPAPGGRFSASRAGAESASGLGRAGGTLPAGAAAAAAGAGVAGAPVGAAPMGAGLGAGQGGTQPHRRRFPFDADDPFETGQKASPPVIGL
jgi:hypothetical protein